MSTWWDGAELKLRLEPPDEQLPQRLVSAAPDLLLVDGDLAEPPPLPLAQAIRQVPGMVTVPIMVGTSGDKRALDRAAREGGIDRLFGLPVDPGDLRGMALTLVRRARQQQWAHRLMARRDPTTGLLSREHFLDTLLQIPLSAESAVHRAVLCLAGRNPRNRRGTAASAAALCSQHAPATRPVRGPAGGSRPRGSGRPVRAHPAAHDGRRR